eukprot:3933774-Rhodomonas_salina.1
MKRERESTGICQLQFREECDTLRDTANWKTANENATNAIIVVCKSRPNGFCVPMHCFEAIPYFQAMLKFEKNQLQCISASRALSSEAQKHNDANEDWYGEMRVTGPRLDLTNWCFCDSEVELPFFGFVENPCIESLECRIVQSSCLLQELEAIADYVQYEKLSTIVRACKRLSLFYSEPELAIALEELALIEECESDTTGKECGAKSGETVTIEKPVSKLLYVVKRMKRARKWRKVQQYTEVGHPSPTPSAAYCLNEAVFDPVQCKICLLYTSPSPRDRG